MVKSIDNLSFMIHTNKVVNDWNDLPVVVVKAKNQNI